jgi:hypothetical protein
VIPDLVLELKDRQGRIMELQGMLVAARHAPEILRELLDSAEERVGRRLADLRGLLDSAGRSGVWTGAGGRACGRGYGVRLPWRYAEAVRPHQHQARASMRTSADLVGTMIDQKAVPRPPRTKAP